MGKENTGNLLKSSVGISFATFASRVLGLLRVRLESAVLGGGALASSWFLAFMIPNLFRRVFGEGALGTALQPLVAETEAVEGVTALRRMLAVVLSALAAVLAIIVTVVSLWALFNDKWRGFFAFEVLHSDRIRGMFKLLPLLMPYAFFICLTGAITAVLNYSKVFVLPALTALLLNIFLVVAMGAAWFFHISPEKLLVILAVITPLAGMIQLILMLWMLYKCGRFPIFKKESFADLTILKRLFFLALPGFISSSALQLSFVIDRSLAVSLGDQAVPALTYVDRIIDLPIGIFAVSFGTVLMSSMAKAAASGNREQIKEELVFSLRHVWFAGAPMAAGVIFFHELILRLLCVGGRYTEADLNAAHMVAVFYGMGIPLFCSVKVLSPVFFARQKMKLPLYISLCAITVNIVMNLVLMGPLKQGGLALATVISSVVNNVLLLVFLARDGFSVSGKTVFSMCRSAVTAFVAGYVSYLLFLKYGKSFAVESYSGCFLVLACVGMIFVTLYVAGAVLFKAEECREFVALLCRRKK